MATQTLPAKAYAGIPLAAVGGFCVFAILLTRAMESYAGAWIAGAVAAAFIIGFGRPFERALLLLLAVLSFALGDILAYQGLRQTLFVALFLMFARHIPLSPTMALAGFAAGFLLALVYRGEISVLFTVAPTVILLLVASWQVLERRRAGPADRKPGTASLALLVFIALVLPFVGDGSRSALLVWLAFGLRLLSFPVLIAGSLVIFFAFSIPDLYIIERLTNSYDELTNPFPEDGINLRAVEALIFLSWSQTATIFEFLFGSKDIIYMPGDFLGFDYDPFYIPHNQIIGLIFQFGFVGAIAIAIYFIDYWKFLRPFPIGRFVMFSFLAIGFVVIHGFVNQDLAIVAGVALWYRQKLAGSDPRLAPIPHTS